MNRVKHAAVDADSHPAPPHGTRHAADFRRSEQDLQEEQESMANCELSGANPDDAEPLLKPANLESKDSHPASVVGWKSKFKPGQEYVLDGITFVVRRTGKRDLHLRPKR